MKTYQVVDTKTKTVVAEGFAERQLAKPTRDEKNRGANSTTRFTVSRGSEHPRGASNGHIQQSKRWL